MSLQGEMRLMWSGPLEYGGCCAGKVSGEAQHVLEAAMAVLLHAVEADDDKVCAGPGKQTVQVPFLQCPPCQVHSCVSRVLNGGHCRKGTCTGYIKACLHGERSRHEGVAA